MGRLIYRMCLVVILVLAVAGGIYYYMTFYQKEDVVQKGTFVNRVTAPDKNFSGQVKEAFGHMGKDVKHVSANVGEAAKDASRQAFAYVGEAAKDVAQETEEAVQHAFAYTKNAAYDAVIRGGKAAEREAAQIRGKIKRS